ncbi:transglycosylase domain-containing protein [Bacillus sp. OTU530]|uniref:transglycosylase domain-containing protein n=1 Tax=Bacillus sp. OTU530 TaxID=3043862 RepID=UPI00313B4855
MSEAYRSRQERKQQEQVKQQEKGSKPPKKGSVLKKVLLACLLIGIVSVGAGVAAFFSIIQDAPQIDDAKLADPLSTKFYDKDGKFIYEYGKEKRTKVTYDQIPSVLEDAFIATEDADFYNHHGIDIKRTGKAIFENLIGNFGSQGGSTITQQVIKNSFLSPQKTVKRKVQEWYLAYKLEQKYSKHDILTMYLNKINLGNRSYGVAAAAKNYYGIDVKDLKKMTLPQAAMLAGLPQSPNNYDPSKPENVEAATKRRNLVLTFMQKRGYITEQQMQAAMKVPVTAGIVPKTNQEGMPYEAFLDAATREVESELKDVDIRTDGLQIYLTLDPQAQKYSDAIMNTQGVVRYPNERFQAALVLLDSKTGEVRAIGSGRNEYKATFRGNNLAVDLMRQPGSTFKPIFDYGPAIENLKWSTYHQIVDEPYQYSNGTPIRDAYASYKGSMSIRDALVESRNVPALKTLQTVGLNKAQAFAQSLGITFPNNQVYESYAIGSNTVSPLEMAGAYDAFANAGVYTKPSFVTKVVFPDGKEINFKQKGKRVMKDYTAYMITDMLRGVLTAANGTGTDANIPGLDVAGKTGTTNFDDKTRNQFGYPSKATNDSWFAGYTSQYTMAVWTGYAKNDPGNYMLGDTTKVSHLIFKAMMEKVGTSVPGFQQPSSVYRMNQDLYIKGAKPDDVPSEEAPSAPDVTPSAPDVTPSAPDVTPSAPDVTPSAPDVTPSAPDVTPSAPDVTPSAPDVTPSAPDATPSAPDVDRPA